MSEININVSSGTEQRPAIQLKTNRGLLKMIIFGILTIGIYPLVIMSGVSSDINLLAARHDGKKTMHYCLLFFLVGPLTLGIGYLVWNHRICGRIGLELARRNLPYRIDSGTFWLWSILGILIIVGPFVYIHKLLKAMNILSADYNMHG